MPRTTTAGSKKEKTTMKDGNLSDKSISQSKEALNGVPPTTTTLQPQVPATARARKTSTDETKKDSKNEEMVFKSNMNDRLEGLAPATLPAGSVIVRAKEAPPPTVLGRSRSATQRIKASSPNSEEVGLPSSLPSTAEHSTGAWKPDELVALEELFKSTNGKPDVAMRKQLAFDLKRYV